MEIAYYFTWYENDFTDTEKELLIKNEIIEHKGYNHYTVGLSCKETKEFWEDYKEGEPDYGYETLDSEYFAYIKSIDDMFREKTKDTREIFDVFIHY